MQCCYRCRPITHLCSIYKLSYIGLQRNLHCATFRSIILLTFPSDQSSGDGPQNVGNVMFAMQGCTIDAFDFAEKELELSRLLDAERRSCGERKLQAAFTDYGNKDYSGVV